MTASFAALANEVDKDGKFTPVPLGYGTAYNILASMCFGKRSVKTMVNTVQLQKKSILVNDKQVSNHSLQGKNIITSIEFLMNK